MKTGIQFLKIHDAYFGITSLYSFNPAAHFTLNRYVIYDPHDKTNACFCWTNVCTFCRGRRKISQKAIKLRGNVDRKQVKKIQNGGEIIWL